MRETRATVRRNAERLARRRAEIVGAAVLRARKDRAFQYALAALLRQEVTDPADFQLIVPLLAGISAVEQLEKAMPELFVPPPKPAPSG